MSSPSAAGEASDPPATSASAAAVAAASAVAVVAASASGNTAGAPSTAAGAAAPGTPAVSSVDRRRPVDVVDIAAGDRVVLVSVLVDRRAPPLPLGEEVPNTKPPYSLKFAWAHSRRGITLTQLRGIGSPRPDVFRLLRVADSDDGGGRRILDAIVPAFPVIVVSEGLPCDVTFFETVTEACYVDAAAFALFVERPGAHILSPFLSFRASVEIPNPSKAAVHGWKVADAARRVFHVVLGEREWGAFCAPGTARNESPT